MSTDPELSRLLAPMTEHEVDLDGPAFRVDRERVLARMARVEPERSRWPLYTSFAAAAAVLLVAGAMLWPRAELDITIASGTATQVDGQLETAAQSTASVRTREGVQIELESQTRVGLGALRTAARLELTRGAVRCTVPHRREGDAFRVVTPDVTVEDIGTVFTVAIDPATRATRVSVEEGEVLIRHGAKQIPVRAPGSWSSAVAEPTPPAAVVPAEPAPTPEPAPVKSARGAAKRSGTLAQEAQLLRQGLAAERQGKRAEASAILRELIRKYPQSPLLPDARSALARVEAGSRE